MGHDVIRLAANQESGLGHDVIRSAANQESVLGYMPIFLAAKYESALEFVHRVGRLFALKRVIRLSYTSFKIFFLLFVY